MKNIFLFVIGCLAVGTAYSQNQTVSSEELAKYITAMDSVNKLTAAVKDTITEMVKKNKAVSASRYNELSKIIGDDVKLAEAKATPEEIAFVKQVTQRKEEETAKVNQTFQSLAKDYVGAATFNKVKKALAADPKLKAKYDSMLLAQNTKASGSN
jgi:hypothetical protein